MMAGETLLLPNTSPPRGCLRFLRCSVSRAAGLAFAGDVQMGKRVEVKQGDRFGRLTVIRERDPQTAPSGPVLRRIECECECGATAIFFLSNLRRGLTASCGCARTEFNTKHGDWGSPEYRTWDAMLSRCRNPSHSSYADYGGRGITVCDRWLCYDNFLIDMGRKPSDQHSIDRIDNSGNYEPGNCRWATVRQQSRNRRSTLFLTFNGETKCATDWGELLGISGQEISRRLRRGWSVERALTQPLQRKAVSQ